METKVSSRAIPELDVPALISTEVLLGSPQNPPRIAIRRHTLSITIRRGVLHSPRFGCVETGSIERVYDPISATGDHHTFLPT